MEAAFFDVKHHDTRLAGEAKAAGDDVERLKELLPVKGRGGFKNAAYTPSLAFVPAVIASNSASAPSMVSAVIISGLQTGNTRWLAAHLQNAADNESIELAEVSCTIAQDPPGHISAAQYNDVPRCTA